MDKSNTRVVAYCRVAYADTLMLRQQKDDLLIYADQNDYHDVVFYLDNGKSGTTFDRPAFSQMTANILAGRVDIILVRDIARIGRNHCEVVRWLEQAVNHRTDF